MNVLEALLSAAGHLAGHKLRAFLTTLGVVFGVGAVISMLSIGAGAEQQALEMIEQLGTRNVIVRAKDDLPDDQLEEMRERSAGLTLRDRDAILEAVPGVELVAPRVEVRSWRVGAGRIETEAEIVGVSEDHPKLVRIDLLEGRFLDALDVRDHAQVCVIGDALRRALFGYEPALGELIKANDVWLEVIGVLGGGADSGSVQGVSVGSVSQTLYIPVTTALRKFDRRPIESPLSEIVVQLGDDSPVTSQAAARVVEGLLDQLHGGVDDTEMIVPEALLEQSRQTQRLFNLVMGAIAGISLLVGGIGIMNIMLATVLERTREIGVRRAVGARKKDILVQFLVESFSISALGGLLGVVVGVGIARAIAAAAGWPTVVTGLSVVLAVGVAVAVGLGAGLYPARRAAELDPIDSLRWE